MNVFSINEVQYRPEFDGRIVQYLSSVDAVLAVKCDSCGDIQKRIRITANGKSQSSQEAVRKAIQQMLDHQYCGNVDVFQPCDCRTLSYTRKVHYDFSGLEEPWKQMFTDLFTGEWEVPQRYLPSKTTS